MRSSDRRFVSRPASIIRLGDFMTGSRAFINVLRALQVIVRFSTVMHREPFFGGLFDAVGTSVEQSGCCGNIRSV